MFLHQAQRALRALKRRGIAGNRRTTESAQTPRKLSMFVSATCSTNWKQVRGASTATQVSVIIQKSQKTRENERHDRTRRRGTGAYHKSRSCMMGHLSPPPPREGPKKCQQNGFVFHRTSLSYMYIGLHLWQLFSLRSGEWPKNNVTHVCLQTDLCPVCEARSTILRWRRAVRRHLGTRCGTLGPRCFLSSEDSVLTTW